MASSPGHFTFLFTDIEGSAHLWEQYPEEMARQLARHDTILKQGIESHGGEVFSRGGDGFCAAFTSSVEALLAAVNIQLGIADLTVGGHLIQVRIGVHCGSAEERGGDYFGDTLNRTARLAASAHGGQIVLSSCVVDAIGTPPVPLGLRELGSHRFRGLERPERVFQVVHPDLDQEFLPLRSSTRPSGNLPTQRVPLVGRQDDVESLIHLIEDRPLVTLTGPGGVGKSSLAIEVARLLSPQFADGVWWIDLATTSSDDQVAHAVSSTLRIRSGTKDVRDGLRAALEDRELLVILDNCEHIRRDASAIARDLTSMDRVRVLATSRIPLGVGGEVTWPVNPLEIPAPSANQGEGLDTAAVRLFVERAVDVDPFLDLMSDLPTVATIVSRLAGLPLAIELAAARLRVFAPSEVLQQLEDLDALSATAPIYDPRHATMERTIRWSWELLTDRARNLLTRLSIFGNSFSLLSAQAVAGSDPLAPPDVAPALAELVEGSMVVHEVKDGASRYSLLEPIRQFAASKLDPRDETRARHHHLDHFVDVAARLSPGMGRIPPPSAMGSIETERQNLMQAVEWGLMHGRPEDAIRLFEHGLWFALYVAADAFEVVRTWVERVLGPPRLDDMWVTQMVECAGPIAAIAARNHDWLRWLDEGRAASEGTETAWSFVAWSGYALMREGRRREAAERFAEVLAGSESAELRALALVGNGLLLDPGAGWGFFEEALDLLPDHDWRWVGRAELWMFVSWAALDAGRYDDVPHYTQMCLDEARRFGLSVVEVHALATAARATLAVDDLTAANDLAMEAVSVAARIFGSNYAVSDAHLVAADVSLRLGLVSDALDHVRHARAAAQRFGIPRHEALADIEEAKITAELGSLEEARGLIDRALRVIAHTDDPLLARRLEVAELSLDAAATNPLHTAMTAPNTKKEFTFLFTDIEGSTRLWERNREHAAFVISEHERILREAISRHAGTVFSTAGDSFAAVFDAPTEAVDAAVEAQLHLQGLVPVRMAVHAGEAEERDGDYFGPTLNRTGRLRDAAHGGQIVCSQVVALAIGDGRVIHLGEHRLKDIEEPERLFQISHPGLRRTFPALRTPAITHSNLPREASSFVGRTQELAEIDKLLASSRLLTLTGSGGCGKTRAAIRLAWSKVDQFRDGAWFVELATITNPASVAPAVAGVLGITTRPDSDWAASIVEGLRDRNVLVVIDNCEHVVTGVARLVSAILGGTANVTVLTTSRQPLHIPGEVVYDLSPLPVPQLDADLAAVWRSDAVRLFVERTTAALPAFRLTSRNAETVASICRHLDGVPLALELAAAQARLMPLEEMERRIDDRFRLLRHGAGTANPHHVTLEGAIEWSFDQLTVPQRILFTRLAVFQDGWTVEAAENVCPGGPVDRGDVLPLLGELADASLVTLDDRGPQPRYGYLESIRVFALDRLGEPEPIRHAHAAHFRELAEHIGAIPPSRHTWAMALTRADIANLRSALDWTIASGDATASLDLADAVATYEHYSGLGNQTDAWWNHLASELSIDDLRLKGRLLSLGGHIADRKGDLSTATDLLLEARELLGRSDASDELAEVLYSLAENALKKGNTRDARVYTMEGLKLVSDAESVQALIHRRTLAAIEAWEFRRDEAVSQCERALELVHVHDADHGEVWVLIVLGEIHLFLDRDPVTAQAIVRRIEAILERVAADQMIAWYEELRAQVAWVKGDPDAAQDLAHTVVRHWRRGDQLRATRSAYSLGVALTAAGDRAAGGRFIGAATAHLEASGGAMPGHVLSALLERLNAAIELMTDSELTEFERSTTEGRSLGLPDVVAHAERLSASIE